MMPDDAGPGVQLKSLLKRYDASEALRARIGIALDAADAPPRRPESIQRTRWSNWLKPGIAFACGVLVSMLAMRVLDTTHGGDGLANEVLASHIRSLMPGHSMDVASADQHAVKPWFNGRLDYAPPVHDLSGDGFPLAGGRLDYVDQRTVAVLVYRRRLHTLDLYIWPSNGSAPQTVSASRQGFNVIAWSDSGMRYAAIADIPSGELQSFAQSFRRKNSE